jgi:hypothetical protein
MITSSILLIFLASFVFYNTSKKVQLFSTTTIETWIQQNIFYSKIIGCLLLIISLFVSINYFGIASGIIFWLITLMSILSLLVMVSPLQKVHYKHLIVVFFILITLEFFL